MKSEIKRNVIFVDAWNGVTSLLRLMVIMFYESNTHQLMYFVELSALDSINLFLQLSSLFKLNSMFDNLEFFLIVAPKLK